MEEKKIERDVKRQFEDLEDTFNKFIREGDTLKKGSLREELIKKSENIQGLENIPPLYVGILHNMRNHMSVIANSKDEKEVRNHAHFVNCLFEIAKGEKIATEFDLGELVEAMKDIHTDKRDSKVHRIVFWINEAGKPIVSYRSHLGWILDNLLGNAVENNTGRFINVAILKPTTLAAMGAGEKLAEHGSEGFEPTDENSIGIRISNEGRIPKEHAGKLFKERFTTREERDISPTKGGLGLGIVGKTIIDPIGGKIEIEQKDEKIMVTLYVPTKKK